MLIIALVCYFQRDLLSSIWIVHREQVLYRQEIASVLLEVLTALTSGAGSEVSIPSFPYMNCIRTCLIIWQIFQLSQVSLSLSLSYLHRSLLMVMTSRKNLSLRHTISFHLMRMVHSKQLCDCLRSDAVQISLLIFLTQCSSWKTGVLLSVKWHCWVHVTDK